MSTVQHSDQEQDSFQFNQTQIQAILKLLDHKALVFSSEQTSNQNGIRTSKCIVSYFKDGAFHLENFLAQKITKTHPLLQTILAATPHYVDKKVWLNHFAEVPDIDKILHFLIERNLLVINGSDLDLNETLLENTWDWPLAARYFHYSTRNPVVEEVINDPLELHYETVEIGNQTTIPGPFKTYPEAPTISLPNSPKGKTGEFWDTLTKRRTWRYFAKDPLSIEDLSALLFWTWGAQRVIEDPEVGKMVLKTSPSGGSLHPTEVYAFINNVQDLEPGIYHYNAECNSLELLRPGLFGESLVPLCNGQSWVKDTAAVFFMTCNLERVMWKYKIPRTYRIVTLDAGHLGQTFQLVATKLGLASWITAAIADQAVSKELGIDGISEIPMYLCAVGASPYKQSKIRNSQES